MTSLTLLSTTSDFLLTWSLSSGSVQLPKEVPVRSIKQRVLLGYMVVMYLSYWCSIYNANIVTHHTASRVVEKVKRRVAGDATGWRYRSYPYGMCYTVCNWTVREQNLVKDQNKKQK